MSEESEDAGPAAGNDRAAESAVNSQIVDAVTAVNAMLAGQAPSSAIAMLGLVGAQTIGLGMHNAVARQQAEATVNAATIAATCARMIATGVPVATSAPPGAALLAMAEAQAQAAILLLRAQAEAEGADAAVAAEALARIAAAAAGQDARRATARPGPRRKDAPEA